jgi:hypothetical protein
VHSSLVDMCVREFCTRVFMPYVRALGRCVSHAIATRTLAHTTLTRFILHLHLLGPGQVGEVVWPGFHILCLQRADDNGGVEVVFADGSRIQGPPSDGSLTLTSFMEGPVREHLDATALRSPDPSMGDKTIVVSRFDWSPYAQPWGVFADDGRRVTEVDEAIEQGTLYVFEGGQFLWPGFHHGFKRNVTVRDGLSDNVITMTTLSLRPLAFRVGSFLTGQECMWLPRNPAAPATTHFRRHHHHAPHPQLNHHHH